LKNFLLLVLVINSLKTYAQLTPESVNTDKGAIGFYEFKPAGHKPDNNYKYPLIIFLHGIGERGNGTTELPMTLNSSFPKLLVKNKETMKFAFQGRQYAFVVLIPQMAKKYTNWQNFYVDEMIKYAKKNLNIDTNKIFLTGWSLGGGGAWKYATFSVENARRLAGIIPVSPAPDYTNLCNISLGKVAVWAHHARDDASVPLHYTEDAIQGINACSPDIPALMTYYPFGGHPYVADRAYDTLNEIQYPNMFQWMAGTTRLNILENNQPPIADAGFDTLVTLPKTAVTLNGSASCDPNDVIVNYSWTLVEGPVSPELTIKSAGFPITVVSGLEPGNYTFRLAVKDEFNTTRTDDVRVQVVLPPGGQNANPVANAGPDIKMRDDNYYLAGRARDFDGTIKNFRWRQVSGPVSITIEGSGKGASISGMSQEGIYGLELTVYDDHIPAGIGKDTVFITREPSAPVYFNYFTMKDPTTPDTGPARYDLLAAFLIFCTLQSLIFNRFTGEKFKRSMINHVLLTYYGLLFSDIFYIFAASNAVPIHMI
jgi:dienelactone hydrolase